MAAFIPTANSGEVVLLPGDFYFHSPAVHKTQPPQLRTLLGSCVSIILWHPERCLAGMSHSILPERAKSTQTLALDGRYCDEAISLFCQEVQRAGAQPSQFDVYLVGGGQMYATAKEEYVIGERNVIATRHFLKQAGFRLRSEHVGEQDYRKVEIDLTSGNVTVVYRNQRLPLT